MQHSHLLSFFIVVILNLLTLQAFGQGIYCGSERIDNGSSRAISANDTVGLVLRYVNPVQEIPEKITWYADGGIEIVGAKYLSVTTKVSDSSWISAPADFYEVRIRSVKNEYSKTSSSYCKYSKGRITVSATYGRDNLCEESDLDRYVDRSLRYTVDILKEFDPNKGNSIAGPACAKAGDEVTFSVTPWVSSYRASHLGYDTYEWTGFEEIAKGGALKYSSNDNSSITFDVAEGAGSLDGLTIFCAVGQMNVAQDKLLRFSLSDGIKSPVVGMSSYVGQSESTSKVELFDVNSGASNCVPYAADAFHFTVDSADVQLSASMAFRTGSDWINVDAADGAYIFECQAGKEFDVRLSLSGGTCGTQDFFYRVSRSLPDDINITFADAAQCARSGTRQIVANGVDEGTVVHWEIEDPESDWKLRSNRNTYSPTITVGKDASAMFIITSPTCPSTDSNGNQRQVRGELFSVPGLPRFLDEPQCVEWGDTSALDVKVKVDSRAKSLQWTLPSGWGMLSDAVQTASNTYVTAVQPDGDGIVTVQLAPEGTKSGFLKVVALGLSDCSFSGNATKKVGVTYPRPNIEIVEGCEVTGGAIKLRINETNGFHCPSYYWDLGGSTKSLTNGTRDSTELSFRLNGDCVPTSYCVRVFPQGTCDESASSDSIILSAKSDIYIAYNFEGRSSMTWKQTLSVGFFDPALANSMLKNYELLGNWKVQSFDDDGNVLVGKVYPATDVAKLRYSDFKPGERVHVTVSFSLNLASDSIEQPSEPEFESPCFPEFDFDFTIRYQPGVLFVPDNDVSAFSLQNLDEAEADSRNSLSMLTPNPTTGFASTSLPSESFYKLILYGKSGEVVQSISGEGSSVSADLSRLPAGIYAYTIETSEFGSLNGRLLKK